MVAGVANTRADDRAAAKPARPQDLALDFDEAARHARLLDPDADRFLWCSYDDDKARVKLAIAAAKVNDLPLPPPAFHHLPGRIDDPRVQRLMQEHQADGWAVSVTVNGMNADRRKLENVASIRAVWAEMDNGEPPEPWPLPPSFTVETSPGKSHYYWLIDPEAPLNRGEFGGIMMCMVERFGSDPDAKDPTRALRLAGTWNLKPGRPPHLARIIQETGARYTAEELIAKFPAPPRPVPSKTAVPRPYLNGGTPPGLDRFVDALKFILPEAYGTWIKVGMALYEASGGSAEGLALWDQWSAASDKWAPGVCEAKWRTFGAGGGITGGTIFGIAEDNGWRKPERARRPISSPATSAPTRGEAIGETPAAKADAQLIRFAEGKLSEVATEAEVLLIAADVQFYQRGGVLVRPISDTVTAAGGRKTRTVSLKPVTVTYMRDQLSRNIKFQKFCGRKNDWRAIDPPVVAAETVLDRAGEWRFRNIVGVVTTPTLRPDGTILSQSGYDPATHLLLVDPPKLPPIADNPSREDALQALELLDDLLGEFPFVDEASRSVAQSAVITPVARGAFSVAPTHVVRSSTPGSGKTYLVDVASAIATGQPCHAIAAGRTEEETEKRLGACLLAGYPMTNVDNVNGEFGGDFVCQVAERPLVSPRVLGRSEQPQLSNRMTLYATGNNIRLKGDMTRRAIICSLDAGIERPELRTFTSKPVATLPPPSRLCAPISRLVDRTARPRSPAMKAGRTRCVARSSG
jgi:hypothetical protein